MATLLGGEDVSLQKNDGSFETVKVLQLPIKAYPQYLAVQDDELKMAEVLCGKPAGWAETLTFDSLELVVNKGENLNSDFFGRWVQRRLARQEKLVPGITARMVTGVASPSPATSPNSPSPAA